MSFLAGEVYSVLGAKVDPAGYSKYDQINAKAAASAEAFEKRHATAMDRVGKATVRTSGVYQDQVGRWREANGRFVSSARQVELGLSGIDTQARKTNASVVSGADAQKRYQTALSKSQATMASTGRAAQVGLVGGLIAVGAAVISSAKKAGDFQQVLAVLKETSKATDREMKAVRKTAVDLGNDITLPGTSARDAADAMNELAKGGLTVTQSMTAAKGVLQLSAAAQISNAEAAKIVADNLNAFNLEARESVRVSDLLAASANATTASIPEMGQALQQSAASAAELGIPIEDLVTMIGELANAGIKGSDAGTSVKTMLASLTPNSDKAGEAIKKLGVETFDAEGKFRGVRAVIDDYKAGLSKLTDEQKAQTIETIFGSDASRAAGIILDGGVKSYDKLRDAVMRTGAAQDLAKAQTEGYNGATEAMKSAVDTAQIAIGDVFLPILTKGAKEAASFVTELQETGKLKDWSEDLLSGGKTAVEVLSEVADSAADVGKVGADAAQGIFAVARALNIDAPTGIEAALAAFLGFKAVGVIAPQLVRLAAGIKAVQAAGAAGGIAGIAGLANPYTAAAIAAGGLAAALVVLSSKQTNDTKLAEQSAAAHKAQAEAIRSVMDAERSAADKGHAAKQSTLDLEQAQKNLNEARDRFGKKSPEYRQALLDEQQAQLRSSAAHREYTNSLEKQNQANSKSVQTAKDRVAQTNREVDAARRQVASSSSPIKTVGGQTIQRAPRLGDVNAAAVAEKRQADAVESYIKAVARANVSDLSRQRLMASASQITERNVQGISQLVSAMGNLPTKKQTQILLTGKQAVLSDLGNMAGRLTALGRQRAVAKVLANANSARAAVLAFQALLAGATEPKVARILATTRGTAEVAALKSLIDNTNSKSVAIDVTTRYRQIGSPSAGAGQGTATPGGMRRRAKGRGADGSERALVGEGRHAREAIVDPAKGVAWMVDRPTIMDLPDTAYVIPEDPAMRGRAMGLLADLAQDLGLNGFKKGKAPAKKKASGKTPAKAKEKVQRDLPADVQPTKLPLDDITAKRDASKSKLDKAKGEADRLPKGIGTTRAQIRDIERRKPKSAAQKRNKADDLARAKKKLADQRDGLRKAKAEEAEQRKAYKAYEKERIQAVKYQREITKQEQLADTAASQMRTADSRDDQGAYDKAKDKRTTALKALRGLLAKARKALADQDSEAARELDKTIAATDSDVVDAEQSEINIEKPEDPEDPDLTDAQKKLLARDDRDISLAGLTATLEDDKAAAGKKKDDLQTILNSLLSGAQPSDDELVSSVADMLKSAKDNYASLTTGGTNSDADTQAQIDQANERTRVANESARLNAQALAVFSGSGDIGTGGPNALAAAGGSPNVTINYSSLVPAGPQDAARAAGWIAGGFGYQGGIPSTRTTVG